MDPARTACVKESSVKYRPEIDGLRAVAVIPVILFHAGFATFSGGFVGVDIFFVISGYLITSIIYNEVEQGRFSMLRFYERRARRILPALLAVSLACIPFAWAWMWPAELQEFGQSLVAVATFTSNILFWNQSGYFDGPAEIKPLLHTWSLAVEEQYYILFPPFLLLLYRVLRRQIVLIVSLGALTSLALAQYSSAAHPSANFYLLPTRAWELGVGVLVALYLHHRNGPETAGEKHRARDNLAGIAGVLFIAIANFSFDQSTPFPSAWALIPVVGTALIILTANSHTIIGKILSNPALVFMGLISYSAYLWHHPLFAFARIRLHDGVPTLVYSILIIATFVLAWLTWKVVENPFRRRDLIPQRTMFTGAIGVASVVVSLGLSGHFSEGFKGFWLDRQPSQFKSLYLSIKEEESRHQTIAGKDINEEGGRCRFNVRNLSDPIVERLLSCFHEKGAGIAILGDSHAIDLFSVATYSSDIPFIFGITKGGCRPHTPVSGCHYD